jgi:hypothetical protein
MMQLDPTHVHLKLYHACDQWHSSRVFTPLTGWHCKFRPNTEGTAMAAMVARPTPAVGMLDLGQCSMSSAACTHLPSVLSCITSVVLSANALGPGAGAAISEVLIKQNTLVSIEMTDCALGDEGTAALAIGTVLGFATRIFEATLCYWDSRCWRG